MSAKTRSDIVRLAVLWIILSAAAEAAAAYVIGGYPGMASRQGEVTSEAVFFLLWVTIPVFVLVALIVVYSMVRFRVADTDQVPSESQYRTGRAFPWGWLVISTVLNVLFVIHPGLTGLAALWSMAEAATDPIEVDVTARQWGWRFTYPGEALENAPELVVPVDTPIRFVLRSADVIHSFWVPAWGIKKAVIPGETRTLVVTPSELVDTVGDPTARLQCSQICGVGHAEMQAVVRVVSRGDFDAWVKSTKAADAHGGMEMPGMEQGTEMPGMEHGTGMPGMEQGTGMPGIQHGTGMPGMEQGTGMPGMQHGTEMPGMEQGTEMPGMEQGTEMPGMKMPGQEQAPEHDTMPIDHSGMEMPGANAPAAGEPNAAMPMDQPMQMIPAAPDGGRN